MSRGLFPALSVAARLEPVAGARRPLCFRRSVDRSLAKVLGRSVRCRLRSPWRVARAYDVRLLSTLVMLLAPGARPVHPCAKGCSSRLRRACVARCFCALAMFVERLPHEMAGLALARSTHGQSTLGDTTPVRKSGHSGHRPDYPQKLGALWPSASCARACAKARVRVPSVCRAPAADSIAGGRNWRAPQARLPFRPPVA